jgi:hypothetical protein
MNKFITREVYSTVHTNESDLLEKCNAEEKKISVTIILMKYYDKLDKNIDPN